MPTEKRFLNPMKSLYRQNKSRRSSRILISATILVLVVFAIDALSGGRIRSLVRISTSNTWNVGAHVASAVAGSGFFSSRRTLQEENQALKAEAGRLQLRIAELVILEHENEALRATAHLAENLPGTAVPISSSLRASPYGTFTIGAGSAEGIAEGDAVLAATDEGRGFVVGYVSEVAMHHALVTQVLAPGASVEVIAQETPMTLEGRGGGNARAEAPRALEIAEGDLVVSPEFGGMAVGIVGSVSSEAASAYKQVYVGLPVNLAALTFVYVIPLGR